MKKNQYNIAVTIFTVAYVVFGMPANLISKRFGPRMLAVYMFAWGKRRNISEDERSLANQRHCCKGLCTLGQGLTRTVTGLIACRFLMGMFEAGFVPGTPKSYLVLDPTYDVDI